MAPWSRVKEKKLKIASQVGVKMRSEWEETHPALDSSEDISNFFKSRVLCAQV
jgi:hypothetical protein